MSKEFEGLIRVIVKVSVDDIIVKSKKQKFVPDNLCQVFEWVRKIGMKLNPKNVLLGCYRCLGYLVSKRGIEVNPTKIQAIQEISELRTVKEVQHLAGQMASLRRFLSRAGETGLPFYQILRRPSMFEWTAEVSEAFQKLKACLSSPSLLVTLVSNEVLYLYLAITPKVVSSVLCSKCDNNVKQIYYLSHVLHGPEERYSSLE